MKILASALVLMLLGIFSALFLILDNSPEVTHERPVSAIELQRTLTYIEKSDPRNLQPGSIASLKVREEDMQLLLDYMLLEGPADGAATVNLRGDSLTILGSVKMPAYLLSRYFNLQITMSSYKESLTIEELQLGKLPIPTWAANRLMKYFHQKLRDQLPEYASVADAITSYKTTQNEVTVTYQWQPELVELLSKRGSDFLIADDQKERLRVHAIKLAEITANPALPSTISLVALLNPMFEFAKSRGGNPVEENAAAILTLALYVMDVNIEKLIGDDAVPIRLKNHRVTLSGRHDFAKHFLTSAAIAIGASTVVADSVGIMKEIEDASAGGSGFSFTDVGADRAGIRFAEFATSNPQNAVFMQNKLSSNLLESMFVPDLTNLPEFMSEDEFKEKFGGINQPGYEIVIADIEERISQLPIFNSL